MLRLLLVLGDLLCRHLRGSNEPFVRSFACSKNRTSSTKCAHKLDLVNEFKSVAHPKEKLIIISSSPSGHNDSRDGQNLKNPNALPKMLSMMVVLPFSPTNYPCITPTRSAACILAIVGECAVISSRSQASDGAPSVVTPKIEKSGSQTKALSMSNKMLFRCRKCT